MADENASSPPTQEREQYKREGPKNRTVEMIRKREVLMQGRCQPKQEEPKTSLADENASSSPAQKQDQPKNDGPKIQTIKIIFNREVLTQGTVELEQEEPKASPPTQPLKGQQSSGGMHCSEQPPPRVTTWLNPRKRSSGNEQAPENLFSNSQRTSNWLPNDHHAFTQKLFSLSIPFEISFLKEMLMYYKEKKVQPYFNVDSSQDFIKNCLKFDASADKLVEWVNVLWKRYEVRKGVDSLDGSVKLAFKLGDRLWGDMSKTPYANDSEGFSFEDIMKGLEPESISHEIGEGDIDRVSFDLAGDVIGLMLKKLVNFPLHSSVVSRRSNAKGHHPRKQKKSMTVGDLGSRRFPLPCYWHPPPSVMYKINTAASASIHPPPREDSQSLAAIIRDYQGREIVSAVRIEQANWDHDIAETMAAIFGIVLAKKHSLAEVILESECTSLIDALDDLEQPENLQLRALVECIRSGTKDFFRFETSLGKRFSNAVASRMSELAHDIHKRKAQKEIEGLIIFDLPES